MEILKFAGIKLILS